MPKRSDRHAWVSYLRVSTPAQAERELSIPAQRRAVQEHAERHGATIVREYVESGCSAVNPRRPAFRRMLEDALRPGSDVAVVVVHHTSRFTRDATEARVVKSKLRRAGVRVLSVCQDVPDDLVGKLIEGLFECIDQYESDLNGVRTSASLAEAVRQGYFPGARPPFGYRTSAIDEGSRPPCPRRARGRRNLSVGAQAARRGSATFRVALVAGPAAGRLRDLRARARAACPAKSYCCFGPRVRETPPSDGPSPMWPVRSELPARDLRQASRRLHVSLLLLQLPELLPLGQERLHRPPRRYGHARCRRSSIRHRCGLPRRSRAVPSSCPG